MAIDEIALSTFIESAVAELSASFSAPLILVGDRLGLYKAMAGAGPLTPAQLAESTGTTERYVREWLCNQAASRYVTYDPTAGTFTLTDEAAFCLADEDSPVFLPGAYQLMSAMMHDEPKISAAFRTGEGVGWHEHDEELYPGTERFFRPGYNANLVSAWLPALDGVVERLAAGGLVADVGCGHGASTIILAQGFPNSRFVGFDYHAASIETARKRATEAGVADRVTFEVASAGATRAAATTLSGSSTRCTTWATPSPPRPTCSTACAPTGRSCWSSRTPGTGYRTTSARSAGSSMPAPRCCAPLPPAPRQARPRWEPRPARLGSVTWRWLRASPGSAGLPRPPST